MYKLCVLKQNTLGWFARINPFYLLLYLCALLLHCSCSSSVRFLKASSMHLARLKYFQPRKRHHLYLLLKDVVFLNREHEAALRL